MNRREIRRASRVQSMWHKKQELKWRPRIKHAMDLNVNNFIRYAKANSITSAVGVIDTLIEMKPISDVLLSLYKSVGMAKALEVRKALLKDEKKAIDTFSDDMLNFITQFFFNYAITYSVLKILGTQRKRILLYLAQQLSPNATEEQIVSSLTENPNLVTEQLQATKRTSSEEDEILRRLRVEASDRGVGAIARTEITRILNYTAFKAASSLPFLVIKTWLSLHDDRTRRAHGKRLYDHWVPLGQTVPLEMPFNVSGEQLMYPGDPAGSPGNLIGCRCGMEFTAVRDSKGKVIYKPKHGNDITVIQPGQSNITQIVTIGIKNAFL